MRRIGMFTQHHFPAVMVKFPYTRRVSRKSRWRSQLLEKTQQFIPSTEGQENPLPRWSLLAYCRLGCYQHNQVMKSRLFITRCGWWECSSIALTRMTSQSISLGEEITDISSTVHGFTWHTRALFCAALPNHEHNMKEDELFQCTWFLVFRTPFSAAATKLSIVWIYFLC